MGAMDETGQRGHSLAARAVDEVKRFGIMFLYLWLMFGTVALNQAVVLGMEGRSYVFHGFAIINALVLAKVMLVAEDLKLGRWFENRPMIVPVLHKACVFAILFIVFHILEEMAVGMYRGESAAASFPRLGGGTLIGVLSVWGIAFVSLIPFFMIRELGRALGERVLWDLLFRNRARESG